MDFFATVMGKRFYEGTMPAIKAAIEKNNAETEELRKTVSELNGQVAELTKALQDLSERIRWSR